MRLDEGSYWAGYEDARGGNSAKQRNELKDVMDEWSYLSGYIEGKSVGLGIPSQKNRPLLRRGQKGKGPCDAHV